MPLGYRILFSTLRNVPCWLTPPCPTELERKRERERERESESESERVRVRVRVRVWVSFSLVVVFWVASFIKKNWFQSYWKTEE